ncbi:MAG: GNAT family N-acetyltransferase [Candidatus Marinimicrobia bacterium]|nr:GNAT family N-acetyltransferase [Candidatus Neomarinimicrobiota bacterium]
MLESGQYFGYFEDHHLVSIAGIHVYSPAYNAAALGNITTHPDYRGGGFATKVTAACCQSLLKNITRIGLNIKADNLAGLTLYKKLGFTEYAPYSEFMLQRKSN